MTIRFLSPAEAELASAARYYEEQVPGLGTDFLDEVETALGKIGDFPEAWAPVSDAQRRCRLHRFPYGLIYEVRSDEIIIASVMHLHRHPDHWKKNL